MSDRVPEVCIQAGGWTGLSHWLISIVLVEKWGLARWGGLPRSQTPIWGSQLQGLCLEQEVHPWWAQRQIGTPEGSASPPDPADLGGRGWGRGGC